MLRWQKAQQHLAGGRPAQALPAYLDLVKRFPAVPNLWFECGVAAAGQLDFDLADRSFAQARELASGDVNILLEVGQQYHRLRRTDKARESFEAAANADPSSIHASLSLAAWLEREHKMEQAWACAEAVFARHPNDPNARYYRAFLLQRQGRGAEAEPILRDLVKSNLADVNLRVSCLHLLGLTLDDLGHYDEALTRLLEAKALVRRNGNVAALEQSYDKADKARRELLDALTPEMIRRWREESPRAMEGGTLALLGGHPRSGTTLLEQILGAHPAVTAFDESEAFATEIWDRLAPTASPQTLTAAALDALPSPRRAEMQGRYFRSLFRELNGAPPRDVVIDKNPGPTAALHLWLRLFPSAKVIIALRDPRDVVLSCFFQNLALTPLNVNFLSLERAARHFGDLMDVWLRLRQLGGFDWIQTRYEDFAGDLEREGRRVTEFLGLTWHPDQARWHEAARGRMVFSPTYSDVTKPAHTRAIGRWKRYEAALEPAQEKLTPYCREFGY